MSEIVLRSLLLVVIASGPAFADTPVLPPGEKEPLLRLDPGGPTSYVTSLAFSPDGKTLYAGGWDKVVRVWTQDATGRFLHQPQAGYRIPIGPGPYGAVNAMAVSPDGTWLTVAGRGVVRGSAGFRQMGLVLPTTGTMSEDMLRDEGTIYVFNTKTRSVRLLRGHKGPVLSMAFAPSTTAQPWLVSCGDEPAKVYHREGDRVGTVRLWNVRTGKYVTGRFLPDPRRRKPGLAVWRTGEPTDEGLPALRVAIAWSDGNLRVWDVRSRTLGPAIADGRRNNTVAYLSRPGQLITGSYSGRRGRLRIWDVSANQPPRIAGRPLEFSAARNRLVIPRALALIPSEPRGEIDFAAVAVVEGQPEGNRFVPLAYRLRLIDLRRGRFGQIAARQLLWKSGKGESLPVVVAAPDGRSLAISGNQDHEILVYSTQELLNDRMRPQRLRSDGARIRRVAFVRKGTELGLLLDEQSKPNRGTPDQQPPQGAWMFSFQQRRLTPYRPPWKVIQPALSGWQATIDDPGRVISVTSGSQQLGRISVSDLGNITDYALLPPQKDRPIPVLAIASHVAGQPALGIFDATSGRQVRQLTGHTERIHGLAFSDDGKLLASAGEDKKVCVWSLSDLDQIIGQHGLLPGVAVREENGQVVVVQVDKDSPVRDELAIGDRLLGRVVGKQLHPWSSARTFYDAFWHTKPGESVSVRRDRPQHGQTDVALRASQGIDEQKPLFSLFFIPGDQQTDGQWVGWSPLGPYESSDRSVDRYLGWHFNTGKPDAPTSFADASQYRQDYYREGLLQQLIQSGKLPKAGGDRKLPRPNMTLWIPELEQDLKSSDGQLVLRNRAATLRMAVEGVAPDDVQSVVLQFDDDPQFHPFHPTPEQEWSADLSGVKWMRGKHKFRALLTTHEARPQKFSELLLVRFQPAAPKLKVDPTPLTVKSVEFTLAALVTASHGEAAQVTLVHKHQGETIGDPKEWNTRDQLQVRHTVQLQDGENQLVLIAKNEAAYGPFEGAETARILRVVTFQPKPVSQPVVLLNEVTPLEDGSEGTPIRLEANQQVVVDVATVRIKGTVEAADKIAEASWIEEEGHTPHTLTGFRAHELVAYDIREDLLLQPGPHSYRFRAKGTSGQSTETRLTIDYRPRLPEVTITRPSGEELTAPDPPVFTLKGHLTTPKNNQEFQAVVLVNHRAKLNLPTRANMEAIQVDVPLQHGENLIQVQLENRWGARTTTEPIFVRYRRPPQFIEVQGELGTSPLLVNIVAHVQSPADLPLTGASIKIGKHTLPIKKFSLEEKMASGASRWKLDAQDVPFAHNQAIELYATNDDGQCVRPGVPDLNGILAQVTDHGKPSRPKVDFLKPSQDTTVANSRYEIRFRVRSDGPLKQIHLQHDGKTIFSVTSPESIEVASGGYLVQESVDVKLDPGPNALELLAINEGGKQARSITLSYVPPPARVEIEGIEAKGPDAKSDGKSAGKSLSPLAISANAVHFAPVKSSEIKIHGNVVFLEKYARRSVPVHLSVWVNGFQQSRAEIKGDALRRSFVATTLLNQRKNNRIEFELVGMEHDVTSRLECFVDCLNPALGQRLHLIVVGIGVKNKKQLTERAMQALLVRREQGGRLSSPAFARVITYPPLAGFVTKQKLFAQLLTARHRIRLRAKGDPPNDIVLIYYEGGELLNTGDGFQLKTSVINEAISSQFLAQQFRGLRGAHIMLLDVPSPGQDASIQLAQWKDDSRAAMICYAWRNPASPMNDSSLLAAWRKALSTSGQLGPVDEALTKFAKGIPNLVYGNYIPDPLVGLVVGPQSD